MDALLQKLNQLLTRDQLRSCRGVAIAQPMGIGDALACLPLAGLLKKRYPGLRVCFIGTPYIKPLLDCCEYIDQYLAAEDVIADPGLLNKHEIDIFLNPFPHRNLARAAQQAGVKIRVGNLRRHKSAIFCNRFVLYSRNDRKSHEIELNLHNLAGLGLPYRYAAEAIYQSFGLTRIPSLVPIAELPPDPQRFTVIFHPKSNKHGREWPASYYAQLAELLPEHRFRIIVTSAPGDREILAAEMPGIFQRRNVINLCGKLPLTDFIALLAAVDGIVASGTGPIHVAAALGKHALGIYPPRDAIDPAHWRPFGPKGEFLCLSKPCRPGPDTCTKDHPGGPCACMEAITPEQVLMRLLSWVQ